MSPADAEALASPAIRRLRAYDPGHDILALRRRFGDALCELGANENPFGPSPRALEAARGAMALAHRYPDPTGAALKRALADAHGLDPAGIVLGNGSHELLMLLGQVFAAPGTGVVLPRHGFAVHALSAMAVGAELQWCAALPDEATMAFGHDLDAALGAVTPATRLLFLANPNNPTGTWFERPALERLLEALPPQVVVVVDEAYQEFMDDPAASSALGLLAAHPRLIVTRTFSKAHGLAGLRVGWAAMAPALAGLLERLRESFNVNGPALAAAEAALGDAGHLAQARQATREAMAALREGLEARGLRCLPSRTNFVLAQFGPRAAALEGALVARGVVLRPMGGYGLGEWLRVSIGRPPEQQRLFGALDEVLA